MTWKLGSEIKAILFDKDGTLVDFDKTWAQTNRKAALLAADGDAMLADILLIECGMDPLTGKTRADSMFAAANANEIAAHMVAHGSPVEAERLARLLDQAFIEGADTPWPICDLDMLMRTLTRAELSIGIAGARSRFWESRRMSASSPAMTAVMARNPSRACCTPMQRIWGWLRARSRWSATTGTTWRWPAPRAPERRSVCCREPGRIRRFRSWRMC